MNSRYTIILFKRQEKIAFMTDRQFFVIFGWNFCIWKPSDFYQKDQGIKDQGSKHRFVRGIVLVLVQYGAVPGLTSSGSWIPAQDLTQSCSHHQRHVFCFCLAKLFQIKKFHFQVSQETMWRIRTSRGPGLAGEGNKTVPSSYLHRRYT